MQLSKYKDYQIGKLRNIYINTAVWTKEQDINLDFRPQGCRFLSKGGGDEAIKFAWLQCPKLSRRTLWFSSTFPRCSEMHPEQFLPNLSA